MRNYYLEQSHGAYTVHGDIGDWVTLDLPESWYGADSDPWNSTDDLTGPVWRVARDAIVKFAADNPGFDWAAVRPGEPVGHHRPGLRPADGYLDHLILIHAGSDQSAGGGAQGADAIWAHSWGIYENYSGGPGDGPGMMIPGTDGQGPQGHGIWAYNYTINPEDGDVGVFCHEFGHDLGLPDQYDYSSATGDASSGFWTIMASGSWLGREWGIGTKPAAMNVWDKSALGFVQPKVVKRGKTATVKLQPAADRRRRRHRRQDPAAEGASTRSQLSGKDGAREWYSDHGQRPRRDARRSRTPVAVPAGDATSRYRTWYDIEQGYDYGFVDGRRPTTAHDRGTRLAGRTRGTDTDHWADIETVDLSAYAGQERPHPLRVHDRRRRGPQGLGDHRRRRRRTSCCRSPRSPSDGWIRVDGEWTQKTDRYYIAEYRTYDGFDEGLKDCYQWNYDYASWVDWFSYNQGLHLIYRDTFYTDNDVATHVGSGGWMVVDARPKPDGVAYSDGSDRLLGYWRPRIQVRDAAFSLKPTKTQSIYFVDYDQGWGVGESTRPRQGRASRGSTTPGRTGTPTRREAGVKIPQNLGVRIQRQDHGRRAR